MTTGRERAALAALYLAISIWAAVGQKPARLVADGTQYHAMAMQYSAGASVVVAEPPFVTRIATPWLASRLDPPVCAVMPASLELIIEEANGLKGFPGFYAVNIVASLAATVFLYNFLVLFVKDAALRALLLTLWILQWLGPVRFTYFYPAYIDPLFTACLFGGLVAIERSHADRLARASIVVGGISFAGMFSRETAMLIPMVFAARHWRSVLKPSYALDRVWLGLPFVFAVLGLLIVDAVTTPDRAYDPMATPLQMLRDKPLFTWMLAWFFAFGPVTVAVIVARWEVAWSVLRARPHLAFLLVTCGVLAFFGGTDSERILAWAWPVVLVLLGAAIADCQHLFRRVPALTLSLVTIALISSRIFWPIPAGIDDATATDSLDISFASLLVILDKTIVMNNYYSNLWSFFGSRAVHAAQLAFDLALMAAVVAIIRRRRSTAE